MRDLRKVLLRQSIRTQLIAGVGAILLVFMSVFTYNVISRQKKFLVEKASQRVLFQTEVVASSSAIPLQRGDRAALRRLLAPLVKDENTLFGMVTDKAGKILAHTDTSLIGKVLAIPPPLNLPDPDTPLTEIITHDQKQVEARAPIVADGELIGWAYSSRNFQDDLSLLGDVTRMGIIHTLLALLIGTLLAAWFVGRILKSLRRVLEGASHLTDEAPKPISVSSTNEIGDLADALNAAILKLSEQRHELERAKNAAEAANIAKSNFLANISHEIRTPLGAVIGFANMLQDQHLTPAERQQYQDILNRNGKELQRMVKNLLDISKVEAGGVELDIGPFKPREMLRDVVETLKIRAEAKGLTLWSNVEEGVPETVNSDSLKIRQILINLVENAIKFTEHGGVALTLKVPHVDHPDLLRLEVEDTGIGMSPDQQTHLFQAFSQIDDSLTRRFGGAGLGLYLARKIARKLGGDIVVQESELGMGTTFLLTFANQVMAEPIVETPKPEAMEVTVNDKPLAGFKILAVEDVKDNQLLIEGLLTKRGAKVEVADNGVEGVQKATHDNFSVVLMDLQMPLLDGYRAVKKLRRLGFDRPIVALTAHALVEDREKALANGFDEYITKPINPADLVNVIVKLGHAG
jgi:signal transduction histidine kinase